MKMEKKQYDPANLSETTLQQVRSLEKTLSEEKGEEIILIAYENDNQEKGNISYKG
ncbi:hypothetical protein [Virgibacillus sp. YIM 98842]|jgi:hypothetical protein|uniref:hypothetical protein n=1 Tax=Virgibacillus sp. YIM 98842 TaxID=2663533 RepID=UPI0013DB910F|nr:hypothetical protein [Virgibacillus sp. YIM 98842]